MKNPSMDRRNFVRFAGLGTLGLVALASNAQAAAPPAAAPAADLPKLELDNPTAKALGYVEDTKSVDVAKYKTHTVEQKCSNCLFIRGDAPKKYRPCTLFPGKSVASEGWCVSWAKLASPA